MAASNGRPAATVSPLRRIRPLAETDTLITTLYAGVLEPTPFHSFLTALRLRVGCDATGMSLRPARLGATPIQILVGADKAANDRLRGRAAERQRVAHTDPLANALRRCGEIATLDEVIPRETLIGTDYYLRLMQPYGFEYMLAMHVKEPAGWECQAGLINGACLTDFGQPEKRLFAALHPHLQRALEIHGRLRRNESEKMILEDSLDRLGVGMFLLDQDGRILEANKVARRIVRRHGSLSIFRQSVMLSDRAANARLREMLAEATRHWERHGEVPFVDVLSTEHSADGRVDFLIRSVSASNPYEGIVGASVIVYVSDLNDDDRLAPEAFVARLFGLTSSEAFLTTMLANGFTLSEAAGKLGITENTVRGYAKNIFAKTGVSRQSDLVRLILKSVAMLG